jgi:hypothetical protein
MRARTVRAGWSELMGSIGVHWNLRSAARIPRGIRLVLEARMASLWRSLGRFRIGGATAKGACTSEAFEMSVEQWTFTYEIDLAEGVAVIQRAIDHARGCVMS